MSDVQNLCRLHNSWAPGQILKIFYTYFNLKEQMYRMKIMLAPLLSQGQSGRSKVTCVVFVSSPYSTRVDILTLPPGKFFVLFCCLLIFFFKSTFMKNSFRYIIWVSNRLDPDQARHFVGPDLDLNCLQKLSAEDIKRDDMHSEVSVILLVYHFFCRSVLPSIHSYGSCCGVVDNTPTLYP